MHKDICTILAAIVIFLVLLYISVLIVEWAWNASIAQVIDNAHCIDKWQSFALLVLAGFLFRGGLSASWK